ncbi:MAG: hypothetical protein M1834_002716 [Cirrosporium novae-zelandiae]|nr:MAG: hypothetical protein M1834_002716 [Cirrosporium novae-zelandiae]
MAALSLSTLVNAKTFTNPLKTYNGSDPFMVYYDGYYYLTTTTWDNIQITRATTLTGLKTATAKTVWTDSTASRCCNIWAPEIHQIDGTWYIYYTAGISADTGSQHPHVLEGGSSPWDSYSYLGQLSTDWGIDGTVAEINDKNYFLWSCIDDSDQCICLAQLTDPSTIGTKHIISRPTRSWEDVGADVNEGPNCITHDSTVYCTYSASYCWTSSYALGLLTLTGSSPTASGAWTKTGPVFSSANGNYGPGHNAWFLSPDESETWQVFHATTESSGACDGNRYTMAQKVTWDSDGTPDFGDPEATGTALTVPSGED